MRSYRVADFTDLAEVIGRHNPTVLDVRQAREYDDGHIPGAVNIPLHELSKRIGEVPNGEVWVHCASGYRSSIAASMIDRTRPHRGPHRRHHRARRETAPRRVAVSTSAAMLHPEHRSTATTAIAKPTVAPPIRQTSTRGTCITTRPAVTGLPRICFDRR